MGHLTKFLAAIMASVVPISANAEDTYFTATGEEDGKPLIFRSMTAVPVGVREADLPNHVIIRWHYETDLNGMPNTDSNSRQIALEDALMPLDVNAIGRQMLVVTGNNRKEWHWYVKDFDNWMDQLHQRLATSRAYPIEISHTYEPQWASYRAFLAQVNGL
ncbi:hypothetical protein GGE50_003821 [Rhizobium leguminosarum]|uniref:DUF695 domain-containing protein n=1 Tax=Rhizobium leguminosarum TaxID=384 RepID=UPI001621AB0F|nr:DUF695 domain-containing protein [Rhizobium leguminosarum]MBB4587917.1 hypothetical protein [Rhizobium leguminosarum]